MAQKEIVWTETAAKQRRLVFDYWNEHNGSIEYSEKLIAQIKQRIDTLTRFPKSGRKTDFRNTFVTSLGGHYSIFYQIKRSKLIITGFWDNRQNPEKLIKLLKI